MKYSYSNKTYDIDNDVNELFEDLVDNKELDIDLMAVCRVSGDKHWYMCGAYYDPEIWKTLLAKNIIATVD